MDTHNGQYGSDILSRQFDNQQDSCTRLEM